MAHPCIKASQKLLICGLPGQESACQCNEAKDSGLIPESGRFPGVGSGNPLRYPCLENAPLALSSQHLVHKAELMSVWGLGQCLALGTDIMVPREFIILTKQKGLGNNTWMACWYWRKENPRTSHFGNVHPHPFPAKIVMLLLLLLRLSRFSCVWLCETPRWQSTRRLRPWDSPGKNTGVGCHFLLQLLLLSTLYTQESLPPKSL